MKILITGGAGCLGSNLIEHWLPQGHEILALDNFATGKREVLPPVKGLSVIEGSVADGALVQRAFRDARPEIVVHSAAAYKDPANWAEDAATNVQGSINVARAAEAAGVRRVINFQTALCYGRPKKVPIPVDHPLAPFTSYGVSKTAGEQYLLLAKVPVVSLRLANVVGPRNVSGPLPIFFQRLSEGKKCFVTKARRDFVFVKDLARTVLRAADGAGRGAYHFSSGKDVAIQDLYDAVVAAMELRQYPAPEVRELGPDDAPTILLDPSRTFQDFGKLEFTSLGDTVAAAVEYYRKFGVHGGYTHLKHEARS